MLTIKHIYFVSFLMVIFIIEIHQEIKNLKHQNRVCLIIPPNLNDTNQSLDIIEHEINFDQDVLALVHIQKTSGSHFEEYILNYLQINKSNIWKDACSFVISNKRLKRKICAKNSHNKPFFWDRYTSRYCDIHAGYTELFNCVMYDYGNRIKTSSKHVPFIGTIHFITMLRDPIQRYISEFHHVKRGATWQKSVRACNEEKIYANKCTNSKNWMNVTWAEFLTCEYNLANNRMTRMLANYNELGCRALKCWTRDDNCTQEEKRLHDRTILESAQKTIASLSFFGLAEYQSLSQNLFEKTFKNKMRFSKNFVDINNSTYEGTIEYNKYVNLIKQDNYLDLKLYEFAKNLFFKRIEYLKKNDTIQ